MVKFTVSGSGGIVIGLGLEDENVRRMQAGQPIRVKLSDLGFTGAAGSIQIMIFTGKDAAAIHAMLAPMIGPDTVVHKVREDI